jgi:glycosyltransferase involved in cell wall biosynthesis
MAKVRVLHVCNQLGLGGTEKTLQTFCKYLDKSRFEVFACGRLSGGVRVSELERLGVQVIVGPVDLTSLVRELKIDICHVHRGGDYEPGSLPEKRHGQPRVVETNVFNALDDHQGDLIDCHLFVSRFSYDRYVREHGGRRGGQYEVLYNPVDFEEFRGRSKDFEFMIGQCARPDEQKWHKVVIDALPKIFRKVPEARAIFQGIPDWIKQRLEGLRLDGRVHLMSPSLGVSDFYGRLDVFTHAARIGETFGCVIAEAMANHLPVVTLSTPRRSKANAQTELVEDNVTGFVCRFSWQYAGAVVELLQNPDLRERFGTRGYEKARDQFDASRLTRKLEGIYLGLMN